jgi:hypothetical protein
VNGPIVKRPDTIPNLRKYPLYGEPPAPSIPLFSRGPDPSRAGCAKSPAYEINVSYINDDLLARSDIALEQLLQTRARYEELRGGRRIRKTVTKNSTLARKNTWSSERSRNAAKAGPSPSGTSRRS